MEIKEYFLVTILIFFFYRKYYKLFYQKTKKKKNVNTNFYFYQEKIYFTSYWRKYNPLVLPRLTTTDPSIKNTNH